MKTIISHSVLPLVIAAMALVTPDRTRAAQVGLSLIEETIGGVETARAVWSSDLGAPITVTPISVNPEVWLFDLTPSGHATNGGGDFPIFGNNGVVSWVEPENPNLFNNLFFVDALHWRLESEMPTAANPNADGQFGILGNGTSLFAGNDNNGDQVFVAVNESIAVPEPASLALLGTGMLGLGVCVWHRRRRA